MDVSDWHHRLQVITSHEEIQETDPLMNDNLVLVICTTEVGFSMGSFKTFHYVHNYGKNKASCWFRYCVLLTISNVSQMYHSLSAVCFVYLFNVK